jgi:hypothetical protein
MFTFGAESGRSESLIVRARAFDICRQRAALREVKNGSAASARLRLIGIGESNLRVERDPKGYPSTFAALMLCVGNPSSLHIIGRV